MDKCPAFNAKYNFKAEIKPVKEYIMSNTLCLYSKNGPQHLHCKVPRWAFTFIVNQMFLAGCCCQLNDTECALNTNVKMWNTYSRHLVFDQWAHSVPVFTKLFQSSGGRVADLVFWAHSEYLVFLISFPRQLLYQVSPPLHPSRSSIKRLPLQGS